MPHVNPAKEINGKNIIMSVNGINDINVNMNSTNVNMNVNCKILCGMYSNPANDLNILPGSK